MFAVWHVFRFVVFWCAVYGALLCFVLVLFVFDAGCITCVFGGVVLVSFCSVLWCGIVLCFVVMCTVFVVFCGLV